MRMSGVIILHRPPFGGVCRSLAYRGVGSFPISQRRVRPPPRRPRPLDAWSRANGTAVCTSFWRECLARGSIKRAYPYGARALRGGGRLRLRRGTTPSPRATTRCHFQAVRAREPHWPFFQLHPTHGWGYRSIDFPRLPSSRQKLKERAADSADSPPLTSRSDALAQFSRRFSLFSFRGGYPAPLGNIRPGSG